MAETLNIVILDAFTTNPGDLSWERLSCLGKVTIYDRTSPGEVEERSRGAQIVLTNKTVLDAATISRLPALRYIGVLATGYNVVDIEAARGRGITVTNIPSYSTDSVAQATMALLLEINNRVGSYARANREGVWSRAADFCYTLSPIRELAGMKLGIIGYGNIGSRVARIAQAFGMSVATSSSKPQESLPPGIVKEDLDTLLRTSDVVSLHCPLTAANHHLINASTLALMKPSAILLNTSRGGLVDTRALACALSDHAIAAAGLDVLEQEPPEADNPLCSLPNCFITPHVAWATVEARERLIAIATDNIAAWIDGHPQNVIS